MERTLKKLRSFLAISTPEHGKYNKNGIRGGGRSRCDPGAEADGSWIADYVSKGDSNDTPLRDSAQNLENAVFTRASGWTVGEFSRALNTGDAVGDKVISRVQRVLWVGDVSMSFNYCST